MPIDGHIPGGPVAEKWDRHRFELKLVNPANKRKHSLIVVGTGLAGASAAGTVAELGYSVKSFCIQDSPRRAACSHSRSPTSRPRRPGSVEAMTWPGSR